jgi:hypothetical protein
LFDKPAFFRRVADWLRLGGKVVLGVWFEGEDTTRPGHHDQVEAVCRRFVCPSLGTRDDYASWLSDTGLQVTHNEDWTDRVVKTWEISKRRVARTGVKQLARILDQDQVPYGKSPYPTGARFTIGDGHLQVAGFAPLKSPNGKWLHFEVAAAGWRKRIRQLESPCHHPWTNAPRIREIRALSDKFQNLTWVGFTSNAAKKTSFYLDNFELRCQTY